MKDHTNLTNIDIKKLYFAAELENICRFGAVDYEINKAIHEFGNEKEEVNKNILNWLKSVVYWGIAKDKEGNKVPKGEHSYYKMEDGPNHTYNCDYDGIKQIEERMQNGFRLFGKYYQGLWD